MARERSPKTWKAHVRWRAGAAARACAGKKLAAFRACVRKRLSRHPAVRRKKRRR